MKIIQNIKRSPISANGPELASAFFANSAFSHSCKKISKSVSGVYYFLQLFAV